MTFRHAPEPTRPADPEAKELVAAIRKYARIRPTTKAEDRERIIAGMQHLYWAAANGWEDAMADAQIEGEPPNRLSLAEQARVLGFKTRPSVQAYIARARERRAAKDAPKAATG